MNRLTLILVLAASAAAAQDGSLADGAVPVLEALANGVVEKRDIRIGAAERNADPPVLWTGELSVPEVPWLRLLLRTEGPPFPPGSRLILFGADDSRTEIDLGAVPPDGYWTDLLPFGRVRLAIVAGDGPLASASALVIDSLAYQGAEIAPYSAHGENQLTGINAPVVPEAVREFGRPVAFLSFLSGGRSSVCTGFLIGRDLLLTNEHCVNSDESCRTLSAAFGYEVDGDGRLRFGRQFRCAGYDPRLTNFDLDVTAVRLAGTPGDDYGVIDLGAAEEEIQGPTVIVQHSGQSPKEVSIADCAVAAVPVEGRAPATDFTHTCDTAKGTSGAPVLDLEGRFRGIHHFGFKDDDSDIWQDNRGVQGVLVRDWLATVLGEPVAVTPPDP